LHVVLSLIGIVAGLIFLFGLMGGRRRTGWTWLFYLTTFLTCITGYLFPPSGFGPPQIVGILTLLALGVAAYALSGPMRGGRRLVFIIGSALALYFNVFVGVTQAFQKIPLLQPLAPTQSEPPFVETQLVVLVLFVLATIIAIIRYHAPARATA
jgi:hypothetical protein